MLLMVQNNITSCLVSVIFVHQLLYLPNQKTFFTSILIKIQGGLLTFMNEENVQKKFYWFLGKHRFGSCDIKELTYAEYLPV